MFEAFVHKCKCISQLPQACEPQALQAFILLIKQNLDVSVHLLSSQLFDEAIEVLSYMY
jgi:hypothetical protein